MPEEIQDPEDDNLDEQTPAGDDAPLDQNSIDAMVQNAQGADELESLLDEIEDESTDEAETIEASETDQLESLVESMESESAEVSPDDILHQATLQDVEESQGAEPDGTETPSGVLTGAETAEAETTEDELDELDALAAAFDDVDAEQPEAEVIEEPSVTGTDAEDLDALLSGLDGDPEETEDPAEVALSDEPSDPDGDVEVAELEAEEATDTEDLGESPEDLDEEEPVTVSDEADGEELEDLGALLEDLDQPSETEDAGESAEAEEIDDVGALLEGLDESAEPAATSEESGAADEVIEVADDLIEDLDETEGETVEVAEDTETPEAEEEIEEVDALLEGFDESAEPLATDEDAAETVELEENEIEDVDALLEDLDVTEEEIENVDALLEGLDESAETPATDEDAAETVELEEDEIEDVDALLEDLDATEEETADTVEVAADEATEAEEEIEDVDALLEGLDDSTETPETDEDAEEELEIEDLQEEEEPSLEVGADEEGSDEQSLDDTTLDDLDDLNLDLDLDDLDLDDDSLPDLDLDDELEDSVEDMAEEDAGLDSVLDELDTDADELVPETASADAENDLDSLLSGDDIFEDDDELFETGLNVGVEYEVAHILATGKPAPSQEGEEIFEDFASVQASLEEESPDTGATILIVDDDEDNIGLFQEALVEGDYEFVEATTSEDALTIAGTQDIDLIIVNLDMQANQGVDTVNRMEEDDTPPIPVIVTSEQNDLIEAALGAGAADHFTRPVGIVDLEYQVPRTVSNLIKLKRAQHVLSGVEAAVPGAQTETPSSSGESLDGLLDDDTDDFLLDDDEDNLFGDDEDEVDLSTLELLDDKEDDDYLPPTARLATGAGSATDPLYPLSDQSKMVRERDWFSRKSAVSNLPVYLGVGLLMIVLAGISAMVTMYVIDMKEPELAEKQAIQRPQPVPVLKPPTIRQAGYEASRSRVRRPDDYQRQAKSVKTRIRNTVRELESQNGAWWSPWRVMRQAGGTVGVLVQGRGNDEIIDAFGVDRSAVREGLRSRRSMNYLRGVGYDLAGKDVDDLTARETFELLSAREIKSRDHIVDVLSKLTDRLATDKAEQAQRKNTKQKRRGTATLSPPRPEPSDHVSQAETEAPHVGHELKPGALKQLGFAIRLPGVPHSGETG